MAAPALKPCPVCRCAGKFIQEGPMIRCTCGMFVLRSGLEVAAAEWNRLADLAEARTNAAVRAALEEAINTVMTKLYRPAGSAVEADRNEDHNAEVFAAVAAIRAQIARLDAAPSAQSEGDEDADR